MAARSINVMITGGAHRVGRAIATDLADHGFGVVIHANSSLDEAQKLADQIKSAGGQAWAIQADVSHVDQAVVALEQAYEAAGKIDILVNNASIFGSDQIDALDEKLWDQHFNIHLKSPAFMSSSLARHLGKAEGMIVNMIDQRVWRLNPTYFSYTLSKAALWTATQTMAQALGPNIRVNAIGPGLTIKNDLQNDEDLTRQIDALVLQRGPELSEFGATIRYLWEAKSVTGQMIVLDGGQHLAWKTKDTNAKD